MKQVYLRIYIFVIIGYIIYALVQTPTLFTGGIIWDERISEYIPWRVESARLIAQGEFPFFTDKVFGGMPLFSTSYVGVLYPLNLLYILFSPRVANFLEFFHTVMGAAGMFFFLRALRLHPAASFMGGILFISQSFLMIHTPHLSMRESAMFAPWISWLGIRLIKHPGAGRAFLLSLAIALQISMGYVQMVMMSMVWLFFLYLAMFRFRKKALWFSVWLAIALGLGVGLMSIQIFPAMEHIKDTFRASMTLKDWQVCSFPRSHMILFFSPRALSSYRTHWIGNDSPGELFASLTSAGWALAVASIFLVLLKKSLRKGPRVRFVFIMFLGAVLTLMLSFGKYFQLNAYLFHIPPFNLFRIPGRWLFLTCTFVSILAALAVHWILRLEWYKRILVFILSWLWWGVFCTASFYIFFQSIGKAGELMPGVFDIFNKIHSAAYQPATKFLTSWKLPPMGAFPDNIVIHLILALILGGALSLSRRRVFYLCMIWVLGLSMDGWLLSHYFLPKPHPSEAITQLIDPLKHPLLKHYPLQAIARIYPLDPYDTELVSDYVVPHNSHLFLGLRSLKGYCPLINEHFSSVMQITQIGNCRKDLNYYENPAPLQMFGVSHLIVNEKRQSPERKALFEKTIGTHYEVIRRTHGMALVKLMQHVPRFDLAPSWYPIANIHEGNASVLLEDPPVSERSAVISEYTEELMPPIGAPLSKGTVEPIIDKATYKKLHVKTEGKGIVLIRDTYWKGWKYRIPGSMEPFREVSPAFGMIYYVPVPGGEVDVELKYTPPGWRKGVIGSQTAMLLWFMIFLTGFSLKRNKPIKVNPAYSVFDKDNKNGV